MLQISLETHPALYTSDHKRCLEFLSRLSMDDYSYPSEKVNFHAYTDVRNEKELMVVKSFLATQNPDHTVLNVWSDMDLTKNILMQPYLKYVKTWIYNPVEEAKGTPLDGSINYLTASDSKHWMQSGVLRFLMLYKYGGIWIDMDMVLLRDFKPILDQEFAYMWGIFSDFGRYGGAHICGPCGALVGGKRMSTFTTQCLEEMKRTMIMPGTPCFDHVMLANVYRRHKFTVFPSVFFNTEWQMAECNPEIPGYSAEVNKQIVEGWFKKNQYSTNLFPEAFSWHWHNSGQGRHPIEKGSKFSLLQDLTDARLKEKGIL